MHDKPSLLGVEHPRSKAFVEQSPPVQVVVKHLSIPLVEQTEKDSHSPHIVVVVTIGGIIGIIGTIAGATGAAV